MANYVYTESSFTGLTASDIDLTALHAETETALPGQTLQQIHRMHSTDVTFVFAGTLSAGEQTTLDGLVSGHTGQPIPEPTTGRCTFAIWAEENSNVSVSANNYEYSFGNGAVNSGFSDVPGIPMGVECTLIGIGVSARGNSTGTNSVSISVTKNGAVVATGAIASAVGTNVKVQDHSDITPDVVNFSKGDTLQFLTASSQGTLDDVRVVAWFERTA